MKKKASSSHPQWSGICLFAALTVVGTAAASAQSVDWMSYNGTGRQYVAVAAGLKISDLAGEQRVRESGGVRATLSDRET